MATLRGLTAEKLKGGLVLAADGKGPLLQRDYWGVIASCRTTPGGVIDVLRFKFPQLVPEELARFERLEETDEALDVGDEMTVNIRGAGTFGVRILHVSPQSFTIGTIKGHPETGRVTFGAYRNPHDDVVFHIRSRARSSSTRRFLGYLLAGEPMQMNVWCELINRTAASVGDGVIGFVMASTKTVRDDEGDRQACCPTYIATGG